MRQVLCDILAKHAGESITVDVAASIVLDFFNAVEIEHAPGTIRPSSTLAITTPMRERIERLEEVAGHFPQVQCPVREWLVDGIYAREISIPAETVVTGAVHKKRNFITLSKGSVKKVSGEVSEVVHAPASWVCEPGTKNAVVALEDAVWTNYFHTNETDPEKIIEDICYSKASELLGGPENRQLLAFKEHQKLEN